MVKNLLFIGLIQFILIGSLSSPAYGMVKKDTHPEHAQYQNPISGENKNKENEKSAKYSHSKKFNLVLGETTNTKGKSFSDPDDDGSGPDRSNGGPDKPWVESSVNKYRDGNNGCGNDPDFEDDNEGWRGSKPKKVIVPKSDCEDENTSPTDPGNDTPQAPKVTENGTKDPMEKGNVLGVTKLPDTASPSTKDNSILSTIFGLLGIGALLRIGAEKLKNSEVVVN